MSDLEKIMEQLDRVEKRLQHLLDHVYRLEDDVKHIRYPTQAFGGEALFIPSPTDPGDPQAQRTDHASGLTRAPR